MIYIFTSAAVNYLPKVRLLFSSIKRHHPDFCTCLVLVDKTPSWFKAKDYYIDKVILIDDLDIPNKKAWIFKHSIVELCTGVKAFALDYLLNAGNCEEVIYFDPDIVVFSRLNDLLDHFKEASILLTPHQSKFDEALDAIIDNEICSMQTGIFNLGFLGIKNDDFGKMFVNWWQKRMEHFCFSDRSHGIFVDQKWVDFAPVFFEGVKIIKSSSYNVATWNLSNRNVTGSINDKLLVDGQPLVFYHFSGFDCGACKYMANKYAKGNPTITSLIKWYEDNLIKDNMAEGIPWVYGHFENGEPITDIHRNVYKVRKDLQEAFPDPFKTTDTNWSFYIWFEKYAMKEYPELFNSPKKTKKRFSDYVLLALISGKDRKDTNAKGLVYFQERRISRLETFHKILNIPLFLRTLIL